MAVELIVHQPREPYKKINGKNYRHIYVVGDIHGSKNKLLKQLKEVKFNRKRDLLIGVGDIIDRGPDSIGTLGLLKEKWFCSVRGNHEDLASTACTSDDEQSVGLWLMNGGQWILNTRVGMEREAVIADLLDTSNLPFVIEVESKGELYVICHACYPHETYEYGKYVDGFATTWDRDRYLARKAGDHRHTKGAKLFLHGHNHTKKVEHYGNHLYIATGAYGTDPLTLFKIQ